MLKIGGTTVQAGTGNVVSYSVEYDRNGTTGHWTGDILLRGGQRHQLAGGSLEHVGVRTIGKAVALALNAEIDSLDIAGLNAQYEN